MCLAGFNDIICAICWRTLADLTMLHSAIYLAVHAYSISFFLLLTENHYMISILGASNFYCVFLVISLTRIYYCQCCVTINCILFLCKKYIVDVLSSTEQS